MLKGEISFDEMEDFTILSVDKQITVEQEIQQLYASILPKLRGVWSKFSFCSSASDQDL